MTYGAGFAGSEWGLTIVPRTIKIGCHTWRAKSSSISGELSFLADNAEAIITWSRFFPRCTRDTATRTAVRG